MKAGSIDKIDFDALPLGKGDRVLHGCAAGYFLFVISGYGRSVFHAALCGGHLGGMQQSGDQSGFATVRMPHYSHVADLTSLVRFHGVLLLILLGLVRIFRIEWERDRETMGTSRGASRWPDWRATCPGLPSTSSIKVRADAAR